MIIQTTFLSTPKAHCFDKLSEVYSMDQNFLKPQQGFHLIFSVTRVPKFVKQQELTTLWSYANYFIPKNNQSPLERKIRYPITSEDFVAIVQSDYHCGLLLILLVGAMLISDSII